MQPWRRFEYFGFKHPLFAVFVCLFIFAPFASAGTFRYPVLGRLTEKNGKPVEGPVTLQVNFYRTETGGASLLSLTSHNVPLQEGIFQLSLELTDTDYTQVFSSVSDLVYVEVTDVTHDPNAPYPRMLVGMTAYAGKVPVDGKTTYFNSSGQLAVGPNTAPSAGQFLTKDGSGNFVWATPSGNASTIGGSTISSTTPTAGQVLKYVGGTWTPTTDSSINKSGDTGVGSLALGSQQTLGFGGLTSAQETTLAGSLVAGDKGKTWFNTTTNQLKYWDGSSAVTVGASGAGLANFNGESGNTQTLAISTASGTAPAWSSASNVHTLTIPLASAASVTAGLLSKTDYDSFVGKLDKAGGTMTGSINLGGNDLRNMANIILGIGDGTGTPVAGTFMGPSALGTDISGTDLTFDASKGTGSSGSGGFAFRVAPSGGASGATANTLATVMRLTNAGYLGIGTTSPTSSVDVSGAITQRGIAAPAVSASAQGRIYFDSTTNKFMVSEHAGAYQPLVSSGTVTSVSGSGPISVATGTTTPAISIAQSSSSQSGYLSSTDWSTFNSKISSTRTITAGTGLSGGGDLSADRTISLGVANNTTIGGLRATTGKLTLDGDGVITNIAADTAANVTGTVAIANGGTGQTTAAAAITALLPTQTSNSGKVLSTNGTSASWTDPTGIQSLNGLSGATQTFAVNTASGTAPAWGSATTVHTLTIPMASAASVTAGLLSKTDYDSFVGKLDKSGGTMTGSINVGGNDLTNTANIVLGTGNATATPVGGTLSAPNAAGTNISGADLTFDASKGTGSAGSGGFIFRTANSGGSSGTTANTLAAAMKLTNAGYLGIGTTTPSSKLQIHDTAANPSLELSGTTVPDFTGVGFGPNVTTQTTGRLTQSSLANGGMSFLGFSANTNVVPAVSFTGHLGSSSPTMPAIGFYGWKHNGTTGRTALSGSELIAQFYSGTSPVMSIQGNGNVGIGTTSPAYKLSIAGRGSLHRVAASDPLAWDFFDTSAQAMGTFFTAGATNQFITGTAAGDSGFRAMGGKFHLAAGPTAGTAPSTIAMTLDTSGNVGIGTSSPTAVLHLKAGTATANTAPLKLTSGTNLTTPEAGAIEYDGTNLFYTDGTATRRTIATTSGALSALAVSNNATVGGTLGVTGAATFSGGATVAANQSLTMSSGTGTFTQTYTGTTTSAQTITANSVTTASASSMTADGLTSGSILNLTSNSTAAAAGNTGLNIGISGANATSSITRYGMQSIVTATGTSSTNVAGYFSASGASNNYGLIVANGNVGIGTTSPTQLQENKKSGIAVNASGGRTYNMLLTDDSAVAADVGGSIAFSSRYAGSSTTEMAAIRGLKENATDGNYAGNLGFFTRTHAANGLTERMRIDSAGYVGIGTTAPDYLLDVNASTTGGTVIQVKNPTAGTGNYADLRVGTDAGTLDIVTTSSTWTTNGWNVQGGSGIGANGVGGLSIGASNSVGILRVYTGGSAAGNERMRVDSDGDVGIGTTNPIHKLHVKGTSGSTTAIAIERAANTDKADLVFYPNGALSSSNLQYNIGIDGNTSNFQIRHFDGTTAYRDFTVDTNGSVGIGTDSPDQKLEVAGSITAAMKTVTFSATPTFDATLGNTQKITLTSNVTSSTLSGATAGQMLYFIICQDATGSRTFTWPTNVKGEMTIGSTASTCSAQSFVFDGTNAYAVGPGSTNM